MAEKRKLFEEVASPEAAKPVAQTGIIDRGRGTARGAIRIWLMILFALVFVMIAVGGKLTDLLLNQGASSDAAPSATRPLQPAE